jgi:hypothetical protein
VCIEHFVFVLLEMHKTSHQSSTFKQQTKQFQGQAHNVKVGGPIVLLPKEKCTSKVELAFFWRYYATIRKIFQKSNFTEIDTD